MVSASETVKHTVATNGRARACRGVTRQVFAYAVSVWQRHEERRAFANGRLAPHRPAQRLHAVDDNGETQPAARDTQFPVEMRRAPARIARRFPVERPRGCRDRCPARRGSPTGRHPVVRAQVISTERSFLAESLYLMAFETRLSSTSSSLAGSRNVTGSFEPTRIDDSARGGHLGQLTSDFRCHGFDLDPLFARRLERDRSAGSTVAACRSARTGAPHWRGSSRPAWTRRCGSALKLACALDRSVPGKQQRSDRRSQLVARHLVESLDPFVAFLDGCCVFADERVNRRPHQRSRRVRQPLQHLETLIRRGRETQPPAFRRRRSPRGYR